MRPLHRTALLLIALAVLPALVFLASRVYSLGENEAILESIYDQQFETLLFSINQHAWEVTNDWAEMLEGVPASSDGAMLDTEAVDGLMRFMATVRAVFWSDTTGANLGIRRRPGATVPITFDAAYWESQGTAFQRLLQRERVGYQQLAPFFLEENDQQATIALAFVARTADTPRLLGFVLDSDAFVRDILAPKLESIVRGQLVLGLFARGAETPVYSTEALRRAEVRKTRPLWLFPDYDLGIRLSGATVEEVIHARFLREMLLIGAVALVLLIGAGLLYRSIRREVALARLKSDFVANVSHELRTPLSLIRMYIETLEMGRVPNEARKQDYYRIISQETERLSRLINNILNFSRIEAGRKTYQLKPTDLNKTVEAVWERYALTFEQEGFTTEQTLAPNLPLALADAEAATEALINLIDNAVKYSPAARFVAVQTGVDKNKVFIEVQDRGMGIPADLHDKIFEQFFRASSSLVHDTKGTGLGLSLVQHIMQAHGGSVSVASKPGKGSCFRLTFLLAA